MQSSLTSRIKLRIKVRRLVSLLIKLKRLKKDRQRNWPRSLYRLTWATKLKMKARRLMNL